MAIDKTHRMVFTEMALSGMMSFLWIGYYGYTYNEPVYNSSPVNWLAFVLWAPGLFLTIRLFHIIHYHTKKPGVSFAVTWLVYFAGLLLIEHIGYNVLAIRQVTSEGPLLFGLIHGTITLKLYYIGAPIIAVLLSNCLYRRLGSGKGKVKALGNKRNRKVCHDGCR